MLYYIRTFTHNRTLYLESFKRTAGLHVAVPSQNLQTNTYLWNLSINISNLLRFAIDSALTTWLLSLHTLGEGVACDQCVGCCVWVQVCGRGRHVWPNLCFGLFMFTLCCFAELASICIPSISGVLAAVTRRWEGEGCRERPGPLAVRHRFVSFLPVT